MGEVILVIQAECPALDMIAANGEDAGYKVLHASSALQALNMFRDSLPDLVMIDWSLPGMGGMELTRRLRANYRTHNLPIILVSTRASELDVIAGLDSGADDYVIRPFSAPALQARIKALLRGCAPKKNDKAVLIGGLQIDSSTRRVGANGKSLVLTPTELRLLSFLMQRTGRTVSREQILASAWGNNTEVEGRTADVWIQRLRKKLKKLDHHCTIDTVRDEGYRFDIPKPTPGGRKGPPGGLKVTFPNAARAQEGSFEGNGT
jgi:two-component system phosphate regulon response regulator PhoB